MPDDPQAAVTAVERPISTTNMVTRRAPDFRTIYSNNSAFSVSPFDFSFMANEVAQTEAGDLYLEQKAKIIMSPLHAKIFLVVLAQNVKNFETQFGEIKIPEGIFGVESGAAKPEASPAPSKPDK